jgi:hypothetical protein
MSTVHELEQASRAGKPVIFVVEDGKIHYADKVFVQDRRVVFFDIGWTDPLWEANPIHVLSGVPQEVGPGLWRWRGIEARIVEESFFLDGEWRAWKSTDEMKEATWEWAEELVRRIGQQPEDP